MGEDTMSQKCGVFTMYMIFGRELLLTHGTIIRTSSEKKTFITVRMGTHDLNTRYYNLFQSNFLRSKQPHRERNV